MAILNALLRTTTTACTGVKRLGGAAAAALAGGVLLSGPAFAQPLAVGPASVTDISPSAVVPGNLEPGDTVSIGISVTSQIPAFNSFDGAVQVWDGQQLIGMETSVDISVLGSGGVVTGFVGTGVFNNNPNCNGTGPSIGSTSASWSGMSLVPGAFATTCTIAVDVQLPSDIPPGLYTLVFDDLTGLSQPIQSRVEGANTTFVTTGATTPFSTAIASVDITVVADTTGPDGTITAPAGPVAPGEVFGASVVFDEPVTGFDDTDLSVANGTVSNFVASTDESGFASNFSFDVTAGATGPVTIDVGAAAAQDAAGNDSVALAQASTIIAGELSISMAFLGDPPGPGDTTSLRFTIQNSDDTETGDITFFTSNIQENLTGLQIFGAATTNTCGSTPSGTTFLIVTGGSVAASSSCILEFDVLVPVSATPDTYRVGTSSLSYNFPIAGAGTSDAASTQFTVEGAEGASTPLAFSKSFTDDPVLPGGSVTLEYTIVPEEGTSASSLAFTDDLDAVLAGLAATGLPQTDVCGVGSTLSGTDTISLTGGNLADGETCTFSVTVQTPTGSSGDFVSATSELTGNQNDGGGDVAIDTGFTASDTLTLINQVPGVTIDGPTGPVAVGEGFTVTIEFSEPVTGFLVGEIDLSGGVSAAASDLQTTDNETYTATITPSAAGTVVVGVPAGVAQDGDSNDNLAATDFSVVAETAAPEIAVQFVGAAIEITDGETTPTTQALTDFGVVDALTGEATQTLRISNTGVGELVLTSLASTDTDNFFFGDLPGAIAGGESADVTIIFSPIFGPGIYLADITISSNDADEAFFEFAIGGEAGSAPEINVLGNGLTIPSGVVAADSSDHTEFVSIDAGNTTDRTFTIENLGGDTLNLGSNSVSILDDTDGVFSVTTQPATQIATGADDTFTVEAAPTTPGTYFARVSIASDDADENPYTFGISILATGEPEVDLQGNSTSIVSGDTTPAAADDTEFGDVGVGSTATATFTIENTGNADLVLTAPSGARSDVVERQSGSTDFTITAQPGVTIAAGATETFTVQYAPSSAGAATAEFGFATNDADEALYTFTVGGTGLVQEIAVAQGATDFTSGVTSFAFNGGSAVDTTGGSDVVTFTISNSGGTTLTLGSDAVSVSGTNSADFTVTDQPDTTVAAGGSTTFDITFAPGATGNREASISIANDDADESPFTFDVTGVGADLTAPTVFEIYRDSASPTALDSLSFTVVFSEDMDPATVNAADFEVTGTTAGISVTQIALSGYTVTISGGDLADLNGTITLDFVASPTITDAAGNALTNTARSITDENTYVVQNDVTPPTLAEITPVTTPTADTTPSYTFSTDEAGTLAMGGSCGTSSSTAISTTGNQTITLTDTDNSTPLSPGTFADCTITVTDSAGNESTPLSITSFEVDTTSRELSIDDVTLAEGDSGTTDFTFTITSSAAANGDITVDFATSDGTAAAGSDYTANSGTATISSGATTTTVTVSVTGETTFEDDETFTVTLSNPTGFSTSITDATGVGTITNDDTVPTISIADATPNEGDGTTTFTVSLSEASGLNVTVDYATADGTAIAGSDYTATSGTLTFTPGDTEETVTVTITDDALDEADETFTVGLTNPSGGTIADATGDGTITDNDATPTLSIADVTVGEGDGTATFTVTLSAASGQTVTVGYATADNTAVDGSDYTAASGTLTFVPGDTEETFTVSITDDALDEADETFGAGLASPTNATISDDTGVATITDNDAAPTLSIADVTVGEGDGTATFTVSLSAASGQTVTVGYATADGTAVDGSDYTAASGTLTFNPGDTEETFTVSITDDALDEADEIFGAGLASPTNATISDDTAEATITDNDAAPALSIADVTVDEGDGTASFTVSLDAPSGQSITVDFATTEGTATSGVDFTGTTGTLTFAVGDTEETVSVSITDDVLDEPSEGFTVDLSNPTNATIDDASGAGSITDNDAAPELTIADVSVSEDAGTATFAVTASAVSGQTMTVDFATADGTATAGSDYTATSGTATINIGSTTTDITVTILDDGVVEDDETYTVDLSSASNATITDASGGGTITNDDAAPTGYTASFDADPINSTNEGSTSFTFANAVVGTTYDFTISSNGGGADVTGSGAVSSASEQVTGIDVSGLGDGTLTLSVTLTDAFGNEGVAANDTTTKETTLPGVVISTASADPVSGAFTVTFTFDEDVTGFAVGEVDVSNGSAGSFSATTASVYTAEITPSGDGTITVDVAAGVAEDSSGNPNTAATQFSIESDSTQPGVTITTASADPVSGAFGVTFTFTEDVTGFVVGDITVGNGAAGSFSATSASVYTATITPAGDGQVTVDVAAGVAADDAGNTNTAATQFSIESDSSAPTVVSLVLSDNDLRVEDVGTPVTATVTFSEALDPSVAPTISAVAGTQITPTFSFVSGAFSDGNTVYTATYDVADAGQSVADIDLVVTGAADPAGNVMAQFTSEDALAIEMRRGGITVVQTIIGSIDGEFDFSGDVGPFSIVTSGQIGQAAFANLAEGDYDITLAEEDGFSITGLACNGGTTAVDLTTRTATVTLAPGDAVECSFEATADAVVDETTIPITIPLNLPSLIDDPADVSATFPLTNNGGVDFDFTITVDQPWLVIDPSAGTIPAGGSLDFTVSLTDAILDLAPGQYTANITITQTFAAGTMSVGGLGTQNTAQVISIPVTVELAPREGTLTIVATTAPSIAGEGVFSFSSDIEALNGLTLTTVGGTASSDGLTVLRGSYEVTQAVSEGWRLDEISCTGDLDGGSTFDVASGTATIDLDPEETLVCTFANRRDEDFIREVTQSAIRSFMAARADQILTHSPDVSRRLRGDRAGATPNSFSFDMTENRLNASMSTSLSAIRQAASERENRMPGEEAFNLNGETGVSSMDVWFQASYSSVTDDRAGLNADTEFGMYAFGVDFMASESILVGVLFQFDQAETVTGEYRSQVEGDGWLAGPYMAARITERMVFDARIAWGGSDNQVNPIGTYWDDFETDRWMAEANLVGDWMSGGWRVSPELGVAYFWEEQGEYTDSLGFVIPSQEITLGRFTAGPEIAYRFETEGGSVFEPYVKVTAVYDYDDTEVININGNLAGLGHFRADARVGLAAEFSNGGRLTAEAGLSGLGEGDFEANTAMFRLRLPLSLAQ